MAINNIQYAWEDIRIAVNGVPTAHALSISYASERAKTPLYAHGSKPIATQHGNVAYAGGISLLQDAYETLVRLDTERDITRLRNNVITVVWQNKDKTLPFPIITDVLSGVEFVSWSKGISQGDTFTTFNIPFTFLDYLSLP